MANTLLTISMVTQDALMVLKNELTFAAAVRRDYLDQFAIDGAKIGDTVNVRRPGRFIGTSGAALNIEDLNETSVPVQFQLGAESTPPKSLTWYSTFVSRS